jgi:hypothetical protein
MGFVDVLFGWRLQRELRRHAAALREEDQKSRPTEQRREAPTEPKATEPKPIVVQETTRPRGWWECAFCGRGFHSYGQFLNHNCHKR